jgi:GAF domain-containing protein
MFAVDSNPSNEQFDPEAMAEAGRNADFRGVVTGQRRLLAEILSSAKLRQGDPTEAYARITEITAQIVDAGRVGLWVFDESKSSILCLDLYIQRDGRHVSHSVVYRSDVPRYFEAVEHGDVVAADDAYTDPRTAEFAAGYLPAFGIGALLDVPIVSLREPVGVMCVEHIGGARKWQARERLLASTLAECAGLVITEMRHPSRSRR